MGIEICIGPTEICTDPTEMCTGATDLRLGPAEMRSGATDLRFGRTETCSTATDLRLRSTEMGIAATDLRLGRTDGRFKQIELRIRSAVPSGGRAHLPARAAAVFEFFGERGAIEVAICIGEEAFIGAGEDGGELLKAEEAGVERVDETLVGVREVLAFELFAIGEDGAFLGAGNDAFGVAAGERTITEFLANKGDEFVGEGEFFHTRDGAEKGLDIIGALGGE